MAEKRRYRKPSVNVTKTKDYLETLKEVGRKYKIPKMEKGESVKDFANRVWERNKDLIQTRLEITAGEQMSKEDAKKYFTKMVDESKQNDLTSGKRKSNRQIVNNVFNRPIFRTTQEYEEEKLVKDLKEQGIKIGKMRDEKGRFRKAKIENMGQVMISGTKYTKYRITSYNPDLKENDSMFVYTNQSPKGEKQTIRVSKEELE